MIRVAVGLLLVAAVLAVAERRPRAFRFEPDAGSELRRMWSMSLAAKAERVACLAGEIRRDTVRITRIRPLGGRSDSLAVSARQSLEICAPPGWQGTVHTHVALKDGRRPYTTMSGADRGVNRLWWRRWNSDGMFCVVFSAQDAYCELDGPGGLAIFPRATY